MRYLVVNAVCCCMSVCCKEVWETVYKLVGREAFVKVVYTMLYLGALVSGVLGAFLLGQWLGMGECSGQVDELACMGLSVLWRVSLVLFIFSLVMCCIVYCCSARVAGILSEGLFFSKYVIIMIGVLFTLYFSFNTILLYFHGIAIILSYIFMIMQVVIFIDLGYLWGIRWVQVYHQGRSTCAIVLIATTVLFIVLTLFFFIDTLWSPSSSTSFNIAAIFFILIMYGVQMLNFNKQNSLLTSSLMGMAVGYQVWMFTNLMEPSREMVYMDMGINFVLMWVTTYGSIYGASLKEQQPILDDIVAESDEVVHISVWKQWHRYLIGLSVYMPIILSEWDSLTPIQSTISLSPHAYTSKVIFSLTTFLAYTWTLLAPRFFPNRNFQFS